MSHITLVFRPQVRELRTETTPAAGSIDVQVNEPAKLEIVSSGFERRLELLPALRGGDGVAGRDGVDGKDGKDGYTPIKGVDYFDGVAGRDGVDGTNGKDGYTPIKGVDYFDGVAGRDGVDGKDGKDGYTPIKGVDYFDGVAGRDGVDGKDGITDLFIDGGIFSTSPNEYIAQIDGGGF